MAILNLKFEKLRELILNKEIDHIEGNHNYTISVSFNKKVRIVYAALVTQVTQECVDFGKPLPACLFRLILSLELTPNAVWLLCIYLA